MRRPTLRDRSALTIGLVGLLASACVQPGSPGVSVTPLKADIVFGVKEVVETAAPPNFTPAPSFFAAVAPPVEPDEVEEFDEKVLEIPDVKPLPRQAPGSSAASDCPPAALTAFPEVGADVAVKGLPREGVYKFKRNLSSTQAGDTASLSGFEQRVIRKVTQNPTKSYEFTYEVLQPNNFVPGQFVVTTFRVNSNPAVVQSINQAPQTIGVVPTPGVEQIVTPPADEPGIFVDKFEYLDRAGKSTGSFRPLRPLKYLALDEGILRAGQSVDTVGIDASTGDTIRHQATVLRKTRVDACGKIVEGWLVEATQTSSGDLLERKYFYNIATQFGALFIAEQVSVAVDDIVASVDLSLADPNPQPLPDNLK